MEAVKKLLVAQSTLEQAASDFFDACTALKTVAVPSLASTPGQVTFENAVNSILSSIESIASVRNHLMESRAVLNKLLNMSKSHAPINKLPSELLGRIFSFAVASSPCHIIDERDILPYIPRVCMKWNQVATNTLSLWSHIDIDLLHFSHATALERSQIWLNRCRNMPIHLHLDGGAIKLHEDCVSDIITVLQPHAGLLSSLTISSVRVLSLIHALFKFALSHGTSGSLKTLTVLDIQYEIYDQEEFPSIPMQLVHGLAELDLYNLSEAAYPNLDDIALILSNCPALHTLRLRHLETWSNSLPLQDQPTISLPRLRLLDIMEVPRDSVQKLLSHLAPGVHELDVRLDAAYMKGDYKLTSTCQPFLARCNVTSLTLNYLTLERGERVSSYFTCVPRLRALRLNGPNLSPEVIHILGPSNNNEPSPELPHLQSLFLVDCNIYSSTATQLGQITKGLRSLVFLSCRYPMTFTPPVLSDEEGEQHFVDDYQKEMPHSMKVWFTEQVERVVVGGESEYEQIYNGVDPLVRELITLN